MKRFLFFAIMGMMLTACGKYQVPTDYTTNNMLPKIYPEYQDVTIPVNIASQAFEILLGVDEAVTRFSAEGKERIADSLNTMTEYY